MPVEFDQDPKIQAYAHPERLVTTEWLAAHLDDPGLVVAESDEDVLLYDTGHIPGAVKIDWHADLNDPLTRDYVDADAFAALMSAKGITPDTTIIFYGDQNNWWAAYALWVTSLFGHADVRLLDGGRKKWMDEGRPMTTDVPSPAPAEYPVTARDDSVIRAYREQVLAHIGNGKLVDVRSPGEYSGELLHMADYPQEGALRGGHIPTAANVPWRRAANEDDGTFLPVDALRAIYQDEIGLGMGDDVIAYCRIGERSSHTWFVLTHLLGFDNV
ncbi:MAG: sulfurtransferase, partial [Thermoleophilia bacterium]